MRAAVAGSALTQLLLTLAISPAASADLVPPSAATLAADVATLTAPQMEGRGAGTPGGDRAAQQIVRWLSSTGLRPGGTDGTFVQSFALEDGGRAVNVIGVLPGRDPALAAEAVLITAHYDHDGRVDGIVFPGADDNASGVAVVIGLVRTFARAGGAPRTLIVALFGAEELGLLGSRQYLRFPTVALERTVAAINFDQVGRLREGRLFVGGADSGSGLRQLVSEAAAGRRLALQYRRALALPSDHARFHRARVPVLFFFTGWHPDQHRPTDTADRINAAGMAEIARLAIGVVERLASGPRPLYGGLGRRPLVLPLASGVLLGWIAVTVLRLGPSARAEALAPLGTAAWCAVVADAATNVDRVLGLVAAVESHLALALFGLAATLPLAAEGAILLGRLGRRRPWTMWLAAGGLAGLAGRIVLDDRIVSRLADVDDRVLAAVPFGLAAVTVALGWWWERRAPRADPRIG